MEYLLNISELFCSFQGESTLVGRKTLFIRLSECNLRCKTCDTKYAFKKGKDVAVKQMLAVANHTKLKNICITGGEPLLQTKAVNKLIDGLLKLKKSVSVETNGSLPISNLSTKVKRIVDVKTPSSGQHKSFLKKNLKGLTHSDELKFVISDRQDFDYAVDFIRRNRPKCTLLLSPNLSRKGISHELIKWMFKVDYDFIFQPQLHKLIKENPVYIKL